MSDELKRRLDRLAEDSNPGAPDIVTFVKRGRRARRARRVVSLAVGIAAALGVIVPLHGLSGLRNRGPLPSPDPAGYPSPPASGYWVLFPDVATPSADGQPFTVDLQLLTNLPDGTLYRVSYQATPVSGDSCCQAVKDGRIAVSLQNDSCNMPVGEAGNSQGFSLTATVAPSYPGPFSQPQGSPHLSGSIGEQPPRVTAVLGTKLENLTGEQVSALPDGAGNELVATRSYTWPEPQCGNDPLPQFGGANCQASNGQLQGNTLDEAMTEVMGAISQARMCEFWGVELTEAAEAAHPWAEFSAAWRQWYMDPLKDFTPSSPNATWGQTSLDWTLVGSDGETRIIEVTNHGTPILELRIQPIPDYCPGCGPNLVPFWGVTGWKFLG